ncbi:zinc-ribbon domain-containing protein [Natronoarchaeum philippinense]|uniref:Zinc-ribbon domain-containing protein n=1 Tax=Natronoarchaeum philippinense TaxID=558529 RepID=A0A285NT64_NATPI|nr:zinc ribbon domain-containing protein [Natronoarchaeum philippinense]SNZ12655.1 zinc-ribbon domain-containing protein [Natronoarchaeum philippinense]
MQQSSSQKRPWLAALLGVLAVGFGHFYIRRWRRALGWLLATVSVTTLFVDPAALEAFATFSAVDPMALAPTAFVAVLSVVDAYVLAQAQNAAARMTPDENGELTHCPHCGKELDDDLEFCQWCTTPLDEFQGGQQIDDRDSP